MEIDGRSIYRSMEGYKFPPLIRVAMYGGSIETLLGLGEDVNYCTSHGYTPLMFAAGHGRKDVVKRLLQVPGINVTARDRSGCTALMYAKRRGHKSIARMLIKAGAKDEPAFPVHMQRRLGK